MSHQHNVVRGKCRQLLVDAGLELRWLRKVRGVKKKEERANNLHICTCGDISGLVRPHEKKIRK